MIGTGFIKCIPITFPALFVEFTISVIDIEDVLLANIDSGLQIESNCLNISILIDLDSVAVSIIKSLFLTFS